MTGPPGYFVIGTFFPSCDFRASSVNMVFSSIGWEGTRSPFDSGETDRLEVEYLDKVPQVSGGVFVENDLNVCFAIVANGNVCESDDVSWVTGHRQVDLHWQVPDSDHL
jgi:hypothetical protein